MLEFVAASSEVLLIATPEPTSITDAYALLKTLKRKSEFSIADTTIKMITNKVTPDEDGEEIFEKLNIVVNRFLKIKWLYGTHTWRQTVSSRNKRRPALLNIELQFSGL